MTGWRMGSTGRGGVIAKTLPKTQPPLRVFVHDTFTDASPNIQQMTWLVMAGAGRGCVLSKPLEPGWPSWKSHQFATFYAQHMFSQDNNNHCVKDKYKGPTIFVPQGRLLEKKTLSLLNIAQITPHPLIWAMPQREDVFSREVFPLYQHGKLPSSIF